MATTTTKTSIHKINGFFVPFTSQLEPFGPRGGMLPVVHYWEAYGTPEEAMECIRRVEAGETNLPGGFPVNNVGERI